MYLSYFLFSYSINFPISISIFKLFLREKIHLENNQFLSKCINLSQSFFFSFQGTFSHLKKLICQHLQDVNERNVFISENMFHHLLASFILLLCLSTPIFSAAVKRGFGEKRSFSDFGGDVFNKKWSAVDFGSKMFNKRWSAQDFGNGMFNKKWSAEDFGSPIFQKRAWEDYLNQIYNKRGFGEKRSFQDFGSDVFNKRKDG